jgi:hypothetical protein
MTSVPRKLGLSMLHIATLAAMCLY